MPRFTQTFFNERDFLLTRFTQTFFNRRNFFNRKDFLFLRFTQMFFNGRDFLLPRFTQNFFNTRDFLLPRFTQTFFNRRDFLLPRFTQTFFKFTVFLLFFSIHFSLDNIETYFLFLLIFSFKITFVHYNLKMIIIIELFFFKGHFNNWWFIKKGDFILKIYSAGRCIHLVKLSAAECSTTQQIRRWQRKKVLHK